MLGVSWYVLAVHLTSQLPMDVWEGLQQNIVVSYSMQMGIGMRQEAAIPPWPEGTGLPCRNSVMKQDILSQARRGHYEHPESRTTE